MAVFNGMFPVLPGKEEDARAFAADTLGEKGKEFAEFQSHSSTTRETWTLAQTPAGAFMLVWFEGDVEKAFTDLATDQGAFATWMRGRIMEVTGIDMSAPDDGAPPEVLVDWRA